MKVDDPDPAAIFGAAVSLYEAAQAMSKLNGTNLSDAYSGADQLMRECMRVATEFESWACHNVLWEDLNDVWPYLLEDKFGSAALYVTGSECDIDKLGCAEWIRIALRLKLPLRNSEPPYPMVCPYCGECGRLQQVALWTAESEEDTDNVVDLQEWQCRTAVCEGRSFWL